MFLGDFFEDMVTGGKKHLSLLACQPYKKQNNLKKYGNWLKIGSVTGQAYVMYLIYRLVQKLTTNFSMSSARCCKVPFDRFLCA